MRLWRLVLFALLCMVFKVSFAEGIVARGSSVPEYRVANPAGGYFISTTAGGACNAWIGDQVGKANAYEVAVNSGSSWAGALSAVSPDETSCTFDMTLHAPWGTSVTHPSVAVAKNLQPGTCPMSSGATDEHSPCVCNTGLHPDSAGTSCVATCVAGNKVATGYMNVGSAITVSEPKLYCGGECEYVSTGPTDFQVTVNGGQKTWWARMGMEATGNNCASGNTRPQVPTTAASAPPPANSCGAGQYGGTVNGKFVCVDSTTGETKASVPATSPTSPVVDTPGETGTKGTTTVTNNPDGSKTTVTTRNVSQLGADGKVRTGTETTTTTCDTLGNCVSDSNSTGLLGGGRGTTDNGGDGCIEGSDLVGCTSLGDPNGGGGGGSSDNMSTDTKDLAIQPQSGWGSYGGCPADKVLQLHTLTLAIPFGLLCTAADMCRPFVIAFAWVSAVLLFVRIASGGE